MKISAEYAYLTLGLVSTLVIALVVSLQAGLLAAFFVLASWWVWRHEALGLYLFIVLAPLLPLLKITQSIESVTLLKDVIIITLFVKLYLLPLVTKRLSYRRVELFLPICALVVLTFSGVVRADTPLLGVLRARDILLYILLYFVVLYLPKTRNFYRQATNWFLISAAIVAGLAIYQWFWAPDSAVLRFDPARAIWIPRISSVMAHPSIFGHYLLLISTLLISLALIGTRVVRKIAFVSSLGLILFIYLTYTRAVWLGYLSAVTFMGGSLMWSRTKLQLSKQMLRPRAVAVVAGSLVLGFCILSFTNVGVFLKSALDPSYASNAERLMFASRLVAPLTASEALVGRGLGDVTEQLFRETSVRSIDIASIAGGEVREAKNTTLVDNQYLKTFIEFGLLGLLIYAWLFALCFRMAARLIRDKNSQVAMITGLWGIGYVAAFFVQGLFIDVWDIFPTNASFWILAGLLSAASQVEADTYPK